MLENEVVLKVAEKHGKTPAQVLLRFIVQKDIVVIPKSTNPERLALNIQVHPPHNSFYCNAIFRVDRIIIKTFISNNRYVNDIV